VKKKDSEGLAWSLAKYGHVRPQTFFQGRAKFSRGGGAKTYHLPKKGLKTY